MRALKPDDQDFDDAYYQTFYGSRQAEAYSWLLATVIQFGKPGSILDLGCGTGLFVELARRWNLDVKGLDSSAAAISVGKARVVSLPLALHDLKAPLPVGDSSYDNIVLNQVIPSLPPEALPSLFAECHRVLRGNGMIFVYSNARSNRAAKLKDPTQRSPLAPTQLLCYLQKAGFHGITEQNSGRLFRGHRVLAPLCDKLTRTFLKDWISGTANARARRV